MHRRHAGFTLAELLIVIAILGVLIAVAVPTFTGHLERGRQAADLANIRSAYAAARAEFLSTGQAFTGYFDGSAIRYAPIDGGYGQSGRSAGEFYNRFWEGFDDLTVEGTPRRSGAVNYLMVDVDDAGGVALKWGVATQGAYAAAATAYNETPLAELKETDNAARIKADQKTLSEIGTIIMNGWTKSDLERECLVHVGNGYRVANYQVNKTGSYAAGDYAADGFLVTGNDMFFALLDALGIHSDEEASPTSYSENGQTHDAKQRVYGNDFLFYSDAAMNNKLRDKNGNYYAENSSNRMLVVNVIKSGSGGTLNEIEIYTKANQTTPMVDENGKDIKNRYKVTLKRENDGEISVIYPA